MSEEQAAGVAAEKRPTRPTIDVWPMLKYFPRLLGFVLILVLAQHAREQCLDEDRMVWGGAMLGTIVTSLFGLVLIFRARGKFFDALCSVPFAVALLTSIAAATVLGTLVLQNGTLGEMETLYGRLLNGWIGKLYLDELFHSLWFAGLLALMCLSLLLVVLRRPFWRPKQWGFVLTHGGMVAVLAGAAYGAHMGERGRLDLHKGQSLDCYTANDGTKVALPFSVRLDKFDVEKYPDELRFVAYRMPHHGRNERRRRAHEDQEEMAPEPEMLPAIPLAQADKWTRISRTDVSLRVTKFEKNPVAGQKPRNLILIEGQDEPLVVEAGQTYKVPGTDKSFKVAQFIPDYKAFIHGTPPEKEQPDFPALSIEQPSEDASKPPLQYWLFAKMRHRMPPEALPLAYFYEAADNGPRATLEFRTGNDEAKTLTLTQDGAAEKLSSDVVIRFENRIGGAKCYRSTVSILEGGKPLVENAPVAVNSPLSCEGYHLYQTNYHEDDSDYSGFSIVRDPGLWLVYLGMTMLSLGVAYIYYVRPRL